MDGIVNIHKDEGPTSFSIVSRVKRLTGVKKAGHAGTLDPAASGVLPVCLGRATRVAEYLMEYPKTYRAEVEFGKTTDTYDREGKITSQTDPSDITEDRIAQALPDFTGRIQQKPPAFSALKHNGKPYYQLARSGQAIDIEARPVTVYSIDILNWTPPVITLDITCGKGTYIRSIAHDLGQTVGCGAYMKSLIRTGYGPFAIENAVTVSALEEAVENGDWKELVSPPDIVLKHLSAIEIIDDEALAATKNGRPLQPDMVRPLSDSADKLPDTKNDDNRYRVYSRDGLFLGLFTLDAETMEYKAEKVLGR